MDPFFSVTHFFKGTKWLENAVFCTYFFPKKHTYYNFFSKIVIFFKLKQRKKLLVVQKNSNPIYLNWNFPILQHEISSLMNWIFSQFETNWIFLPVQTGFFSSFTARVKHFDGRCLTLYSHFTMYRDIDYQLLVWWIHYNHWCE